MPSFRTPLPNRSLPAHTDDAGLRGQPDTGEVTPGGAGVGGGGMRVRDQRRAEVLAGPLAWACVLAAMPLAVLAIHQRSQLDEGLLLAALGGASPIPFLATCVIGALVVTHRPANLVGWALTLSGLLMIGSDVAGTYATLVSPTTAGGPATWAAWYASWGWSPAFVGLFVVVPLLFPDGRLPTVRWRWLGTLWLVAVPLQVVSLMLKPGPIDADGVPLMANPLGVEGLDGLLWFGETAAAFLLVPTLLLAVPLGLRLRFRRSHGAERAQVKWFLLGVAAAVASLMATTHPLGERIIGTVGGVTFLVLPLAIGAAILRHRLYDIDRLISRTVAYALLTGVLVALYVGAVFGLRTVLLGEGSSDLAVAGSTLLVAAAFQPLRRRVQGAVDRRFDRARYDAERTVAAFRSTLRAEVDLAHLSEELQRTVAATVSPASTSLWLRSSAEETS
jgi:hypothetical protein